MVYEQPSFKEMISFRPREGKEGLVTASESNFRPNEEQNKKDRQSVIREIQREFEGRTVESMTLEEAASNLSEDLILKDINNFNRKIEQYEAAEKQKIDDQRAKGAIPKQASRKAVQFVSATEREKPVRLPIHEERRTLGSGWLPCMQAETVEDDEGEKVRRSSSIEAHVVKDHKPTCEFNDLSQQFCQSGETLISHGCDCNLVRDSKSKNDDASAVGNSLFAFVGHGIVERYDQECEEHFRLPVRSFGEVDSRNENVSEMNEMLPNLDEGKHRKILALHEGPLEMEVSLKKNMRPYSRPIFIDYPREDLLGEGEDVRVRGRPKCPSMFVDCYGIELEMLLDTGSELSCISEATFGTLRKRNPNIQILPVPNTLIIGVTGRKSEPCKRQAYVEVTLPDGNQLEFACLIVKNLLKPLIMGVDSLQRYGFILNLNTGECRFEGPGTVDSCLMSDHGQEFVSSDLTLEDIRETVSENNNLEEKEKGQLVTLLSKYQEVFSVKPGVIEGVEHEILIKDKTPFKGRVYPVPVAYQAEVEQEIRKMESWGIIKKCKTPYISPLVVVRKKEGGVRICIDGRELNARTEPQRDTPPRIEEILRRFHHTRWYTTTDITAAYWQVAIREQDQTYTGFLYNSCTYVFLRTPFGLKNSGATLIRAVDHILGEEDLNQICCYIDDVLVATDNVQKHLEQLERVLKRFLEAGMTLKFNKSSFLQREVTFLGHILSGQGIRPEENKISGIKNFPRPRNLKQLRGFLGLGQYYAKFCPEYATHTVPLLELLRGNPKKWYWTERQEKAFLKVKEAFSEKVTLTYPDYDSPLILQSDSSGVGLGSVLYQDDQEGNPRVIAFLSRTLKGPELRYTTTELEALSFVWAMQRLRPWIVGHRLIIRTDHKALSFLKKCSLLTGRLARWTLALEEYTYEIQYCKGKENHVADLLSRNPAREEQEVEMHHLRVEPEEGIMNHLRQMHRIQERDDELGPIRAALRGDLRRDFPGYEHIMSNLPKYRIRDLRLQKNIGRDVPRWRVCVPEGMTSRLITYTHEYYAHYGVYKITQILKEKYTWNRMADTVRLVLRTCDLCQRMKTPNRSFAGAMEHVLASKPNETVALDVYGPLVKSRRRNRYILVVVDLFSKYTQLYPLRRANAKECLHALLKKYFVDCGKPQRVLSDHGTAFTSDHWRRQLREEGVACIYSSIRHPQSNPSERPMKEIGRLCRVYCSLDHSQWLELIPYINRWMNEVPHTSIGMTPLEAHTGRKPERFDDTVVTPPNDGVRTPEDVRQSVMRNLNKSAADRRRRQKGTTYQFRRGEKVLLKAHRVSDPSKKIFYKFKPIFQGPFMIGENFGPNAFKLVNERGEEYGIYNSSNLKPYYS